MNRPAPIETDLERQGLHLTIFACSAIFILAAGLAALMYAALFSQGSPPITGAPRTAFFGFCVMSILLVAYIVDRQVTIEKLRVQIAGDRKKAMAAQEMASRELLRTLPNLSSLQDRLPMEYRRASTSAQELSILIIQVKLQKDFSAPSAAQAALGDAAKAVARKLRDQDSLYLLQMYYFAIVLPAVQLAGARAISSRIAEGLMDVAGTMERFSFKIEVINYPEHASTANELETLVRALIPDEHSRQMASAEIVA